MGRRKERRLAAMSAAGRRVKLDLFAEPSGDLGDSTVQEGVGRDGDSRTRTELPSSPHSSGQQPQNPLILLGQYSDEESEDGSTEGQNHPVSQGTSISTTKEEIVAASEDTQDVENNDGKEHKQIVEQLQINDDSASQDPTRKHEEVSITLVDSGDLHQRQADKKEETKYTSAASDERLTGDMSSGWKMVLHEESNQYYYWNILTGETSWVVPDVFAQEIVTSVEGTNGDVNIKPDASAELDKSNTPLDMEEDYISREVGFESNVSCQNCEGAVQGTKTDDPHEEFKGDATDGMEGNNKVNQSDDKALLGQHPIEYRSGTEFPSQLIKQCEDLLERLNSVKGLNCHIEDKDFKVKCDLEIEVRLADIRALASHGSSLLTFWMHSEDQLKRLEAAVDDAINRCPASPSGFEAEVDSSVKKELVALELGAVSISKSSNFEAHDVASPMEQLTSLCHSSTYSVDMGGKSEMTGTVKGSVLPPRPTHSGEDEDMDVDMEVEDTSTVKSPHGDTSGAHHPHVSPELSSGPTKISTCPLVEEWIPPPPPDSEPFPPPPPDDEPFPPPPPDEPPETSYPTSLHLGSVLPFPYPEQYASSYPGSGLEYYGQTNLEASASSLYTHPEGQVAMSHLPHYYEAVPNVYGITPLGFSPIDSTAYYGTQNASRSQVPLISGASGTSIALREPVPEDLNCTKQVLLDSLAQGGSGLLAKPSLNVGKSGNGCVNASEEVLDAQPAFGVSATSMANGVSVTSTSDTTSASSAAAAAATAATKVQAKVARSKKRTVATVSSLRSNKKVSNLVDKWKAAKEELQEEEEEPENAYEVLERKRQREIEEWRAQQIASGEAKDNANFQPLGGDWRERVKRRRAERMMKEKKQSSPDATPDGSQQQVDLVELSKGLPSGWQAYWDDSSKQVYYGNVLTSETTWIRPAD